MSDLPLPNAAEGDAAPPPAATPEASPPAVELAAETTAEAPPAPVDLSPAATAARLAELFPAIFAPGAVAPLKLRIQGDIQQRAPGIFTKKSLSIFLHRHTTGTAYLKALAAAPQRIDLDGQPAGEVSEEHRSAAAAELARRRAAHDARRAAERDAQREAQRQAHDAARRAHAAEHQARDARVALLRAFETTTLTRANFCALKGVPEAELDNLLAQARADREERATMSRPTAAPGRQAPRDNRQRPPGVPTSRRPDRPPRPPR